MSYFAVGFVIVLLIPLAYALGTLQRLRPKCLYPLIRLRDQKGESRAAETSGRINHL
jgi:hypothetical protein